MTESVSPPIGRPYSGLSRDERVRGRRRALLDAALQAFGTRGYAAVSVKQICADAGLTQRYFYESFRDREDCLAVLYTEIAEHMRAETISSAIDLDPDLDAVARRSLQSFIEYLTADPRRARVIFIEAVGVSTAMEERRHRVLHDFAGIVAAVWSAGGTRTLSETEALTTVALVGSVNQLLVNWLMNDMRQSPALLVDVCSTLFAAARQRLAP